MRTAIVKLESIAPYSQSRKLPDTRGKDETWGEYEKRTWQDKAHYDDTGHVFIPPFAFKQALDGASKYLGKIQGKGNATWTKRFVGGVVITDSIVLPETREKLIPVTINANSDGVRGSGKRVDRTFPVIAKWSGELRCTIVDDEITKDVFADAFDKAGAVIGIGRFRPEKGGCNGRFIVKGIKWS